MRAWSWPWTTPVSVFSCRMWPRLRLPPFRWLIPWGWPWSGLWSRTWSWMWLCFFFISWAWSRSGCFAMHWFLRTWSHLLCNVLVSGVWPWLSLFQSLRWIVVWWSWFTPWMRRTVFLFWLSYFLLWFASTARSFFFFFRCWGEIMQV